MGRSLPWEVVGGQRRRLPPIASAAPQARMFGVLPQPRPGLPIAPRYMERVVLRGPRPVAPTPPDKMVKLSLDPGIHVHVFGAEPAPSRNVAWELQRRPHLEEIKEATPRGAAFHYEHGHHQHNHHLLMLLQPVTEDAAAVAERRHMVEFANREALGNRAQYESHVPLTMQKSAPVRSTYQDHHGDVMESHLASSAARGPQETSVVGAPKPRAGAAFQGPTGAAGNAVGGDSNWVNATLGENARMGPRGVLVEKSKRGLLVALPADNAITENAKHVLHAQRAYLAQAAAGPARPPPHANHAEVTDDKFKAILSLPSVNYHNQKLSSHARMALANSRASLIAAHHAEVDAHHAALVPIKLKMKTVAKLMMKPGKPKDSSQR